jgi:condensin complex subunit 2
MAYFDKAFNSRAKGKTAFLTLENWRMQKIQRAQQAEASGTNAAPTRQRKEKEPFEIDFLGPMSESLKELLEQPPVLNSQISLPKTQWRTKGRNMLDKDDELVDPRKLMRLWTKPKCRVGRLRRKDGGVGMGIIDEGFGARNRLGTANTGGEDDHEIDEEEGRKGDYDANFFADDDQLLPYDGPLPIDDDDDDIGGGDDGQAFMDAREMLSPQPESQQQPNLFDVLDGQGDDGAAPQEQSADLQAPNSQPDLLPGSFGSQLVTQAGKRLRPEYVNYARTAKKVDVRRLKENLWKGMEKKLIQVFERPPPRQVQLQQADEDVDMMDVDEPEPAAPEEAPTNISPETAAEGNGPDILNFTEMIHDLRSVYPDQQMKDISTSYCFICLLHLANEKGLVLEGDKEGEGAMQEIRVMRDPSVGEGYEGE